MQAGSAPVRRRAARGARTERVARDGWLAWAAVILLGAVLPVAQIFGWEAAEGWSLLASLVHAVEFAVFAVLLAVAWRRRVPGSSGVWPAAALSAAYGLLVEVVQGPIPYRDFDLRDLAFDVAGIAAGLLLLTVARRARMRRAWRPPARGSRR